MRGADEQPGSMFSYVSLEERVPHDHPLRAIHRIADRRWIVCRRSSLLSDRLPSGKIWSQGLPPKAAGATPSGTCRTSGASEQLFKR